MSKQNTREMSKWDVAISEARSQIAELEVRIAGLERSIKTFRMLRDKGMPFPQKDKEDDASAHV
jgi:hypothetical protein